MSGVWQSGVVLAQRLNETLTAICTEAINTLNVMSPPVALRVADRFTAHAEGKITEQENPFDPHDVILQQSHDLQTSLALRPSEYYRAIHPLTSPAQAEAVSILRKKTPHSINPMPALSAYTYMR